jgi:hypothetical protein
LKEITEALELNLEQIRDLQIPLAVDLAEALPLFPSCSLQGLPAFLDGEASALMRPQTEPIETAHIALRSAGAERAVRIRGRVCAGAVRCDIPGVT